MQDLGNGRVKLCITGATLPLTQGWLSLCIKPQTVDPPPVLSIAVANGTVTLTLSTTPGRTYRAQYQNDLGDVIWNQLGPDVVATGPSVTIIDNPGPQPHRFYRGIRLD